MSKNIKFPIFLLRFFLPLAGALVMNRDMSVKDLPEYSEYLRQQGLLTTPKFSTSFAPMPAAAAEKFQQQQKDSPINPIEYLPLFKFCIKSPNNAYGNIYCTIIFGLLIFGIVIYYLRSFLKIKESFTGGGKQKDLIQLASIISLLENGRTPSYQNFDGKSPDEANISRLLSIGQIAVPINPEVPSSNGGKLGPASV